MTEDKNYIFDVESNPDVIPYDHNDGEIYDKLVPQEQESKEFSANGKIYYESEVPKLELEDLGEVLVGKLITTKLRVLGTDIKETMRLDSSSDSLIIPVDKIEPKDFQAGACEISMEYTPTSVDAALNLIPTVSLSLPGAIAAITKDLKVTIIDSVEDLAEKVTSLEFDDENSLVIKVVPGITEIKVIVKSGGIEFFNQTLTAEEDTIKVTYEDLLESMEKSERKGTKNLEFNLEDQVIMKDLKIVPDGRLAVTNNDTRIKESSIVCNVEVASFSEENYFIENATKEGSLVKESEGVYSTEVQNAESFGELTRNDFDIMKKGYGNKISFRGFPIPFIRKEHFIPPVEVTEEVAEGETILLEIGVPNTLTKKIKVTADGFTVVPNEIDKTVSTILLESVAVLSGDLNAKVLFGEFGSTTIKITQKVVVPEEPEEDPKDPEEEEPAPEE